MSPAERLPAILAAARALLEREGYREVARLLPSGTEPLDAEDVRDLEVAALAMSRHANRHATACDARASLRATTLADLLAMVAWGVQDAGILGAALDGAAAVLRGFGAWEVAA